MTALSVLLPTWKNESILWLPLEGLIRQRCDVPWELIVMECESNNKELIESYKTKLEKAGCKNLSYIHSHYRMPLATKWKMMAEKARGRVCCLQASDDYPQSRRNQKAWDGLQGHDWFHSRYFYQYSFKHRRILLYDKESFTKNWKTGFNISLPTRLLRRIPDTQQPRGIDFYIYNSVQPKKIFYDEATPRWGVSTDGYNTLSTNRHTYFVDPKPPFLDCDKTIFDIGLPKVIAHQIHDTVLPYELGYIEGPPSRKNIKLTGRRVKVLYKKNFKGRRAGNEYLVDEGLVTYLKYRGVLGNDESKKTKTMKL